MIPYTPKAQTHFPQLRKALGIEYDQMLFFDDEAPNIHSVRPRLFSLGSSSSVHATHLLMLDRFQGWGLPVCWCQRRPESASTPSGKAWRPLPARNRRRGPCSSKVICKRDNGLACK